MINKINTERVYYKVTNGMHKKEGKQMKRLGWGLLSGGMVGKSNGKGHI